MERIDALVIGAGVVGLAVARALALAGRDVAIVEREASFGQGTSSRNSEVVHAGIYYPAGSLKAALCVEGRERLYRYAAARGVAVKRLGKLMVATSEDEIPRLVELRAKAAANGVSLAWLSRDEARALEPELSCVAALHSPRTGIVDGHGLMSALLADARTNGAMLALKSEVRAARVGPREKIVEISGVTEMTAVADVVVNSAGLFAPELARRFDGLVGVPEARFAKGNYYSLAGRAPFSRLVYPMPNSAGLGVHLTLDLAGQARFGPDVEWVDRVEYSVDPRRADAFYAEIRRYWPALPDDALVPAYAGVRPKLHAPGSPAVDFVIDGPEAHGIPGLVNLYGIESPGLTSCLALASRVLAALGVPAPHDPDSEA